MDYVRNITLDVNTSTEMTMVKAKQGDNSSRIITVSLEKDAVAYSPESGSVVQFRMEKPDGTAILNNATVNDDGTVTITLTSQCLAVAGRCKADIIINKSGVTLSTTPFIIYVVESPDIANRATSSDEFKTLEDLISQASGAKQKLYSMSLTASGWSGTGPYTHSVTLPSTYTVTSNTKVDLLCTDATMEQLDTDGVDRLYVANNSGTLTAYSVGAKPTADITVQASIYEAYWLT